MYMYPIIRFLKNDKIWVIKNIQNSYIVITSSNFNNNNYFYKIPSGFKNADGLASYLSLDTLYSLYNTNYLLNECEGIKLLSNKLKISKPLYYNRFKYVGKGFKLIFRKKKNLFNCIFGYSHIYWIKLQNTFIKKTKKYKFFYTVKNMQNFLIFDNILKTIKPINRYTLRGVRTYTKPWIKRKGRKSVATHV